MALHDEEMVAIGEILSSDMDKLDYFYSLPPSLKKCYIIKILQDQLVTLYKLIFDF